MILRKHTEKIIRSSAQAIWDFVNDPKNWTASNPEEHRGLEFFNDMNRPETGVEFYQREYVAGTYADLRGLITYAHPPQVCVWAGVAKYKMLGGLLRPSITEGGTVTLAEENGYCRMSHDVFMNFPEGFVGKFMYWYFRNVLKGEKALYDHTQKELNYFNAALEGL